jgi:hypothetical protein
LGQNFFIYSTPDIFIFHINAPTYPHLFFEILYFYESVTVVILILRTVLVHLATLLRTQQKLKSITALLEEVELVLCYVRTIGCVLTTQYIIARGNRRAKGRRGGSFLFAHLTTFHEINTEDGERLAGIGGLLARYRRVRCTVEVLQVAPLGSVAGTMRL